MDRHEFIEKLQRALSGGVSSERVAENVRYYQDYIDTEIRGGKSEAETLAALGDPRLLAKSIIEANKRAGIGVGMNQNFDEERQEDETLPPTGAFRVPGWLILVIVAVIALLIIGVVFSVLSFLSPVLIPALLVLLIVNYIKRR